MPKPQWVTADDENGDVLFWVTAEAADHHARAVGGFVVAIPDDVEDEDEDGEDEDVVGDGLGMEVSLAAIVDHIREEGS